MGTLPGEDTLGTAPGVGSRDILEEQEADRTHRAVDNRQEGSDTGMVVHHTLEQQSKVDMAVDGLHGHKMDSEVVVAVVDLPLHKMVLTEGKMEVELWHEEVQQLVYLVEWMFLVLTVVVVAEKVEMTGRLERQVEAAYQPWIETFAAH